MPTVLLAGNPNAGKSCLFNRLTGASQHVGNYPGVTVEHKEGRCRLDSRELKLIDLPGTYSLAPYSPEEEITRRMLLNERPEVVVDVVDATNLERNLYLTSELIDLELPLVMALNMSDQAAARGILVDEQRLEAELGIPVVRTVGHRGSGTRELAVAALSRVERNARAYPVHYGNAIEAAVNTLRAGLASAKIGREESRRWLALRLLCADELVAADVPGALAQEAGELRARIEGQEGQAIELLVASRRYEFAARVCRAAVRFTGSDERTFSEKIDTVLTHRVLAIPIFLALMYGVFQLTFTVGEKPMAWIETGSSWLGATVNAWWPAGSESILRSLLVDGVIAGVGGVVVFLPNIVLLFAAIALLEESGYMARAAYIMDRLMRAIGLHGKSFIPMLIGFGCSVPGIMATRSLEHRRDRLATMLVLPLVSCGARLPIYVLIIPAFFPGTWHAPVLWVVYLVGIVLAVAAAKLLRLFVLHGPAQPFLMELPPYRLPTLSGIVLQMSQRAWIYLKKAGTVILGISIVLWALSTFPRLPQENVHLDLAATPSATVEAESEASSALRHSAAGRIGIALEPLLRPMGFDWRIGTALIGAVAAKEVFVAQMGIVFAVENADEESLSLRERLQGAYDPLSAFCIMLFCLISAPCMATVAVVRRESGSWSWALAQWAGLTLLAWMLTTAVYQLGRLGGLGL